MAPKLYGVFENGLAYEYYPGCTLDVTTVADENIWPLVARQLAKMHKVELDKDVCNFFLFNLSIFLKVYA